MSQTEPILAIIGGGVGGAAAALRAAQYSVPTVWVLGDRDTLKSSRGAYVVNIDNMIGIHPDIVGEKVLDLLDRQHPEARDLVARQHYHISTMDIVRNVRKRIDESYSDLVTIITDRADKARRSEHRFTISLDDGGDLTAEFLLLSTGVMDRQPVIHKKKGNMDLSGIQWVFPYANHETFLYCIRCEGHLTRGRRVAVIGSGPAASEVALMLKERYGTEVTLLTAGGNPSWNSKRGVLLERMRLPVHTSRLIDIQGEKSGSVIHALVLEDGTIIEVDLAFVAMGLERVYNDLAVDLGARLEETDQPAGQRHVVVDRHGETSVEGLFAVGDMAQRSDETIMKQVYTAQEYAVRAVDTVDRRRRRASRQRLFRE